MSEAPKELWADWDYEATDGVCGVHTHKKYASGYEPECPPIRYVRADRIEELEAKLAKAEALLAALGAYAAGETSNPPVTGARKTTLAELKGQNDE